MGKPKYKQVSPDVADLYWENTAGEIREELGIGGSTYQRAIDHTGLPRKTNENRLEHRYGVPADWLLDTLHNTLRMSVNEMSTELPVSRKWVSDYMGDHGIPRRGQSDAERLKWQQMSEEEREEQVAAAHEAARNDYAQFRTTLRGYEAWRDGVGERASVKHHRLLATLLVGDVDDLDGMHVHHKNGLSWDNRLDNLAVVTPEEHLQLHGDERRDETTGRFA